jgi:hypothetical protein
MDRVDAFGQMSVVALRVVEQHPGMPAADVAAMYSALLGFAGTGAWWPAWGPCQGEQMVGWAGPSMRRAVACPSPLGLPRAANEDSLT